MFEFTIEEIMGWSRKTEEIMFQLIATKPTGFTADNFYKLCVEAKIPPSEIKRYAGKLFKEFQAAGYTKKTDKYELSQRNGSSPLPIWEAANDLSI